MIIAIDGPAGAGKSELARRIAGEMNCFNLNSGAFYRAAAVKILDMGLKEAPDEQLVRIVDESQFEIVDGCLHLDGSNIEGRIRQDIIDHWSSVFAVKVPVRHAINRHLRRIVTGMSIVAEGRDMTTVVFPHADVKIYLTANPEIRAMRRYKQGTSTLSLPEIERVMRQRDHRDSTKLEGSLAIAEDAIVLDTSDLHLDEVYDRVIKLIQPI